MAGVQGLSLLGVAGYGASGGNPVVALQQAVRTRDRSVAAAARQPAVKRDVAAFQAAVASAPDLKTLLANPAARRVLLTANGLGDQADSRALAQAALMSDPAKPDSLADRRWAAMAQTFQFGAKGLAVLKDPAVVARLADGYAEIQWRKSLDAATPGLSAAMDFRDRAKGVTSALQILGDPVLRDVVTTALGLPKELALQSVEAQERTVSARLEVRRLQEPKFVDQFAQRYLLAKAGNASPGVPLFA